MTQGLSLTAGFGFGAAFGVRYICRCISAKLYLQYIQTLRILRIEVRGTPGVLRRGSSLLRLTIPSNV